MVITGTIRGTSSSVYRELSSKSLSEKRWSQNTFFSYTIVKDLSEPYVYLKSFLDWANKSNTNRRPFIEDSLNNMKQPNNWTKNFEAYLFHFCTYESNKVSSSYRKKIHLEKKQNLNIFFCKHWITFALLIHDTIQWVI